MQPDHKVCVFLKKQLLKFPCHGAHLLLQASTGPRKPSALPFRLRAPSLSETRLAGMAFQLSAVSVFQRRAVSKECQLQHPWSMRSNELVSESLLKACDLRTRHSRVNFTIEVTCWLSCHLYLTACDES